MSNPYRREKVENWVSDFCQSDQFATYSPGLREHGPAILTEFLDGACHGRDVDPEDIEEQDVRHGLLGHVARINLPAPLREEVPLLCGDLLEYLQSAGRLAEGSRLGALARALRVGYEEKAAGKPKPIVNPGSKLGRNDPCPCGSGQKYKKCCMK